LYKNIKKTHINIKPIHYSLRSKYKTHYCRTNTTYHCYCQKLNINRKVVHYISKYSIQRIAFDDGWLVIKSGIKNISSPLAAAIFIQIFLVRIFNKRRTLPLTGYIHRILTVFKPCGNHLQIGIASLIIISNKQCINNKIKCETFFSLGFLQAYHHTICFFFYIYKI